MPGQVLSRTLNAATGLAVPLPSFYLPKFISPTQWRQLNSGSVDWRSPLAERLANPKRRCHYLQVIFRSGIRSF